MVNGSAWIIALFVPAVKVILDESSVTLILEKVEETSGHLTKSREFVREKKTNKLSRGSFHIFSSSEKVKKKKLRQIKSDKSLTYLV